jgi:tryptophan-rich sensory protein
VASAMLEGAMAGTGVKTRLQELRMPKLAPPLWVWTIIGGGQYALFFLILQSLLGGPRIPFWTNASVVMACAMLAINGSWNGLFFRRKDLRLSFFLSVPYGVLAVVFAITLFHIGNPIAKWYLIYAAYLVFGGLWGYRVWQLNRPV